MCDAFCSAAAQHKSYALLRHCRRGDGGGQQCCQYECFQIHEIGIVERFLINKKL